MFKIANKEKGADVDDTKAKILPITEIVMNKKNTVLGHVIRAGDRDSRDPMYQVTFENQTLKPKTTAYRRVGRPRHKWHEKTLEAAWQKMSAEQTQRQPYEGTELQRNKIKKAAVDRVKPFAKTKPENKRKAAGREQPV